MATTTTAANVIRFPTERTRPPSAITHLARAAADPAGWLDLEPVQIPALKGAAE